MKRISFLLVLLFLMAGCSSRVQTVERTPIGESRLPARSVETRVPVESSSVENTAPEYSPVPVETPNAPNIQTPNVSRSAPDRLGNYVTQFDASDTNRGVNISLAAKAINGKIVMPGEEFSFNDTVGSTTAERGYKEATVFVGGKKSKNFGGGVCQVSTTLCNAAIDAGMTITERHDHSLPVNYVGDGEEAATSNRGDLDFKFINETSHPIMIYANSENGTITVSICAA
ncbi:MAG: VanW family protein [Clostridiales bacterium]|jgi:vancomycin resistance protein YoaR|nr:VanW family protein [Clostridiales bacterium]